jgi:hypothetical protein
MRRISLALKVLAAFFLLAGAGLIVRAYHWPVYTDPKAWDRLADKWDPPVGKSPASNAMPDAREADARESDRAIDGWYDEIGTIETPHKRWFDLGCGLVGSGIGLLLALGVSARLRRAPPDRRRRLFWRVWALAFSVPVLGDIWFYTVRAFRGDYPSWADRFIFGWFQGAFNCVVGWILASLLLLLLLARRDLPETLDFVRPRGPVGWVRFGILLLWQFLLFEFVFEAIYPFGDPGLAAGATLQSALLLQVMAAPSRPVLATDRPEAPPAASDS